LVQAFPIEKVGWIVFFCAKPPHILSWLPWQHIFFQKFCEKWKLFKSSPFFFILFLKRECKKNIGNVQKMLCTYHGWKHFMNIVDIFINSCLKNNFRKKKDLKKKKSFFTKI
jgi:hypothetical protein